MSLEVFNKAEFRLSELLFSEQEAREFHKQQQLELFKFLNERQGEIFPLKGIANHVIIRRGSGFLQVARGFISSDKDRGPKVFAPDNYVVGKLETRGIVNVNGVVELHKPDCISDDGLPDFRLVASVGSLSIATDEEIREYTQRQVAS